MEKKTIVEKILNILLPLGSGVRYTLEELAGKSELSVRQVQRYISSFRNAGFGIENRDGFYWIDKVDGTIKKLNDLLYFTEEEAYILQRAIHSIDDTNPLKEKLANKLYSLYKFGKVAETIIKRERSEVVHKLSQAIERGEQALLKNYHSAHSNIVRDRMVEPFEFTQNFVMLWAFDRESRTCKQFKTSRIEKVLLNGKPAEYPNLHKALPVDVFRISSNEKIKVQLRLSLRAYNLMIEEYPLSEKDITPENDTMWHFDGWVAGFEGVGRFVMGLADEVEIVAPQSLQEYVKEKAKKILYQPGKLS